MFRLKNLELSALFTFSVGNDVNNSNFHQLAIFDAETNNYSSRIFNAWTPDNTNTDVPRVIRFDPNDNNRYSDVFLEDASYLKVKNLQLAYNFRNGILRKISVANIRAFVTASNLYTVTGYSGFDPEINSNPAGNLGQGLDNMVYPQTRSFTIGLDVNF